LVDGEISNELAHTVAAAAEPVTTTGESTDFVSAVVDAPNSESADDLEDGNSELIEKYNYIAWK